VADCAVFCAKRGHTKLETNCLLNMPPSDI
jgi:hypothetical protein